MQQTWIPASETPTTVDEVSAAILIDVDNIWPIGPDVDAAPRIAADLLAIVHSLLDIDRSLQTFRVRLYGGWMADGTLSQHGSILAAALSTADPFPLPAPSGNRLLRGSVELATRILDVPGVTLDNTTRLRDGAPAIRLRRPGLPDGCVAHESGCPAVILRKFTRSRGKQCPAPGCEVLSATAFASHEQKMVDTMLTCDLLGICRDAAYSYVTVLSSDTDFVPALLAASTYAQTRLILGRAADWRSPYVGLLLDRDVRLLDWSPV